MEELERRALTTGRVARPRRRWRRALLVLAGLLGLALAAGMVLLRPESATPTPDDHAALLAVFGGNATPGPPRYLRSERQSFHLPMRDGVDIAVDLHLPAGMSPDDRLPVILMPTRYWRRWNLRWPASLLMDAPLATRMFTAYGYAVVAVDARGTGASFGVQTYPWSPDEIEDYLEVLDWAVQQPWSNGRAGVTGVSYGGTCAERVAAMGHPALKAAVVQFALYDVFSEVAYPGGVFNSGFVGRWGRFNDALDNGTLPLDLPWFYRVFVLGPAPVDGPQGAQKLAQATLAHAENADIYLAAAGATSRDQTAVTERGVAVAMDDFSPHTAWKKPGRAQRPALYAWGGWFDGAYANSLLRRWCEAPVEQRLALGPWNHGGVKDVDPFADKNTPVSPSPRVQLLEQIRFFDWYLKERGHRPDPVMRYRRFGESAWRTAAAWPAAPVAPRRLHLRDDATLAAIPGGEAFQSGADMAGNASASVSPSLSRSSEMPALPAATDATSASAADQGRLLTPGPAPTGLKNRWRTQLGRGDVVYEDMGEQLGQPGRLSWTSAPLDTDTVLEGSPLLRTAVAVNATDLSLFGYLEAISPQNTAHMLSEGMLRALYRKEQPPAVEASCSAVAPLHSFARADMATLEPGEPSAMTLQFLPVAARIPKGFRLRVTLSACDTGQFTCQPYDSNPEVLVLPGGALELPVAMEDAPARHN